MIDEDDLSYELAKIKLNAVEFFDNFNCEECNLPLKNYGCDPLIFGENDSFSDRFLCYKCSADFFCEEDYHCEITAIKNNVILVESTTQINQQKNRAIQMIVRDVLKSFALGMNEKEILHKFNLTHKDILACYAFAAERV